MSTARSRELGEELRRIRHRTGRSSADTAEALGWSLAKLSKLETGNRGAGAWDIATLIGRLGADKPTRDHILAILAEPDTGGFLRPYDQIPDTLVALSLHEQLAVTITAYEPLTVPSLAQTEDYAHALTGNWALARTRITRQNAADGRAETTLYIHEAALRVAVGGPALMRDQLLHLTLMCGWTRSTPRLIPMSAPFHPAVRNPATLLTFKHPNTPLAYTETDTAAVFHEEPHAVTRYQAKMRRLASLALSRTESHDVFARWADVYDRETR
ncbi:helix-turn-helix transcriptional regulator [Actinosynnema sp. NPDC050801]|uniref:helix-turn-helix domain-containing protein n=1 Tax=unclassified Actinosynnema TaxID=2637065 RepID=UPI0033DB8FC7